MEDARCLIEVSWRVSYWRVSWREIPTHESWELVNWDRCWESSPGSAQDEPPLPGPEGWDSSPLVVNWLSFVACVHWLSTDCRWLHVFIDCQLIVLGCMCSLIVNWLSLAACVHWLGIGCHWLHVVMDCQTTVFPSRTVRACRVMSCHVMSHQDTNWNCPSYTCHILVPSMSHTLDIRHCHALKFPTFTHIRH